MPLLLRAFAITKVPLGVPRLLRSRQEASGRKLSGLCPFLR